MAELIGKEIFSVGNWNGTDIDSSDLDEIIKAFEENQNLKLPLKLGHTTDQKLIQADGLPAAGWISKLYRKGEKLMADFTDIPAKIYELIEKKAYRQVSSEVFFNIKVGDKKYKKMLAGVALLGADMPGVMNLNDILAMYGHKDLHTVHQIIKDETVQKHYFVHERIFMSKTALEEKLEVELAEQKANFTKTQEDLKKLQEEKSQFEKEVTDLREFRAKSEKETLERANELKKAQLETFIAELKSQKLCTKAMEPMLREFLGEDKKEYSVKITDKEQKKFDSKQALLKECFANLSEAAKKVNFDESSKDSDPDVNDKLTEKDLAEKINKYAAEKDVSVKVARRALGIEVK